MAIVNINKDTVEYLPNVRVFTIEHVHHRYIPLINSAGLSIHNLGHLARLRKLIADGVGDMTEHDVLLLTSAHPILVIETITAIYAKFGFVKYWNTSFDTDTIIQTQWETK